MAENRIQKLLFNEYSDFEDIVLIESPFAQTTKDGVGVRQVQMGLTPTKLILAGDILEKGMHFDPTVPIDPHIGTLELLSLFPVECVNMSVYRRKNRNTLKAHFCNDQVIYFELAASLKRDMYWNLWCERIKFLNPEEQSLSTHSETSVGSTSVSTSTQYKSSRMENTKRVNKCAWDCKDIYLGENFGQGETVIERKPRGLPHIPREKDICNKRTKGKHAEVCLVNRFGQGISENCCTNLFLPVQVYITPKFDDMETIDTAESEELMVVNNMQMLNQTMDTFYVANNIEVKHRRRYGIAPMGILFHALGSISVQKPQLFSLQLKRCCSEVYISYVESEIEEMLGFPKRLLTSSVSCENLIEEKRSDKQLDNTPVRGSSKYNFYHGDYFFWTSKFWFKPWNGRYGYKKLLQHMENVQMYLRIQEMEQRKTLILTMKASDGPPIGTTAPIKVKKNSFINSLIKATKFEIEITSWDFNSTMFAYQLTAIDRDLFIQIPLAEFSILVYERSTVNTPHIRAMIAFAERIINLVTTEIIRLDSVKLRAKLIAKYINIARRLEHLQNMHTTKTILLGLQSPAIYRLQKTWKYVRYNHNNKYRKLFSMLQSHKEIRSRTYGLYFESVTETRPFLPALLHIIAALLGRLPPELFSLMTRSSSSCDNFNKEYYQLNNKIPLWPTISDDSNLSESSAIRSLSSASVSSLNVDTLNKIRPLTYHNPLLLGSLANTNSHIEKVILNMEEWQRVANQFGLMENPLLKEFLLRSKYMEQDECFIMSLKMEPPDPPEKQSQIDLNKFRNYK